jgi:hypothetical protein
MHWMQGHLGCGGNRFTEFAMTPDEDDRSQRPPVARIYFTGLRDAASGNAHAFGFSILITVTYGVVSNASAAPTPGDLFGFALSGVAAFSLLNVVVAALTRGFTLAPPSERRTLIATATDFLAVGAGVGAAYGVTLILGGWAAWLLAPFAAGLIYVLVQALELGVGREFKDTP